MTKRRKKTPKEPVRRKKGVAVKPWSYEPTAEEMEEVIQIDAAPDELADAVVRSGPPVEQDDRDA